MLAGRFPTGLNATTGKPLNKEAGRSDHSRRITREGKTARPSVDSSTLLQMDIIRTRGGRQRARGRTEGSGVTGILAEANAREKEEQERGGRDRWNANRGNANCSERTAALPLMDIIVSQATFFWIFSVFACTSRMAFPVLRSFQCNSGQDKSMAHSIWTDGTTSSNVAGVPRLPISANSTDFTARLPARESRRRDSFCRSNGWSENVVPARNRIPARASF